MLSHGNAAAHDDESITVMDPDNAYEFPYSAFMRHASRPIVECDLRGLIRSVNDRFLEVTGWSVREVLGRPVEQVLEELPVDCEHHRDHYDAQLRRPAGEPLELRACDAGLVDARGTRIGTLKICFESVTASAEERWPEAV
ncbi:MAG: PAS domain S-box protein [Thermoanaerobaculia bacterium]